MAKKPGPASARKILAAITADNAPSPLVKPPPPASPPPRKGRPKGK